MNIMKKNIFFMLGAVALMAACTEDYSDEWAVPMKGDTPASSTEVTQGGDSKITVTPVEGVINFADFAAEQTTVKLCTVNAPAPKDTTIKQDDYIVLDSAATFQLVDGTVTVDELKGYLEGKYGKAPYERTINAYVYTTYTSATMKTRSFSDAFQLKAQLKAPKISQNYYVVGGTLDWAGSAASKEAKFNHSDINVYDDPIFTITIPLSAEGDTWFAIGDDEALDAIANNNDWSKLLGTTSGNGNSGTEGFLAPRTELPDDGSFKIPGGSKYALITIDMMNASYKIETLNFEEFIYVPGNGQGWNPGNAAALRSPNFDGIYTGYVYLDGGFKFTKARNWDAEYNWSHFTSVPSFLNNGAGSDTNIYCDDPSVYFLTVNVANGTIEGVKISNMNLVGDFNGWNAGDDAQQMTWDKENACYTITGAGVTANGWKFTANNGWDYNLGGDINDLTKDGANISTVGTTIKLYPCRTTSDKMYCTIE